MGVSLLFVVGFQPECLADWSFGRPNQSSLKRLSVRRFAEQLVDERLTFRASLGVSLGAFEKSCELAEHVFDQVVSSGWVLTRFGLRVHDLDDAVHLVTDLEEGLGRESWAVVRAGRLTALVLIAVVGASITIGVVLAAAGASIPIGSRVRAGARVASETSVLPTVVSRSLVAIIVAPQLRMPMSLARTTVRCTRATRALKFVDDGIVPRAWAADGGRGRWTRRARPVGGPEEDGLVIAVVDVGLRVQVDVDGEPVVVVDGRVLFDAFRTSSEHGLPLFGGFVDIEVVGETVVGLGVGRRCVVLEHGCCVSTLITAVREGAAAWSARSVPARYVARSRVVVSLRRPRLSLKLGSILFHVLAVEAVAGSRSRSDVLYTLSESTELLPHLDERGRLLRDLQVGEDRIHEALVLEDVAVHGQPFTPTISWSTTRIFAVWSVRDADLLGHDAEAQRVEVLCRRSRL
mmetsp:Transcript_8930/g.36880  ORF Transcript_8930/g.36880 Transcript_8930/m.36880 type:complete len:462 (+) Transcript_8930:804-2189(+)